MLKVQLIPILKDNYVFVIINEDQECVIVDPGVFDKVDEYIKENNLKLKNILITHHHWDHTNGLSEFRKNYDAKIIASFADKSRVEADIYVKENEKISILEEDVLILDLKGHTLGLIGFYFEKQKLLFPGDAIFAMGCGYLFEGTYAQMHESLNKIANLPKDTLIYCTHEYTLANARFCLKYADSKELKNKIKLRYQKAKEYKALNKPTIPTSLKDELETNLFLKAKNVEEFREIREGKNLFS